MKFLFGIVMGFTLAWIGSAYVTKWLTEATYVEEPESMYYTCDTFSVQVRRDKVLFVIDTDGRDE